eukprot:3217963-Alexandrium_andersonii.AAC.1
MSPRAGRRLRSPRAGLWHLRLPARLPRVLRGAPNASRIAPSELVRGVRAPSRPPARAQL